MLSTKRVCCQNFASQYVLQNKQSLKVIQPTHKFVRSQLRNVQVKSQLSTASKSPYSRTEKGDKSTDQYRVLISKQDLGIQVSPWHNIQLYVQDGVVNFVNEIQKNSSPKYECATGELFNPIKQDTKKGKLRFYPYDINWNYGFLPQTWEDPKRFNKELNASGDNDPVDVVEIGSQVLETGGVYQVKPIAVYAMIDSGEVDWKVIAINVNDPKASQINDVDDVEREFPGELEKVRVWFRDYKTPDGKPQNPFGYDNKPLNKEFTFNIIKETHEDYNKLKSGLSPNDDLSLI